MSETAKPSRFNLFLQVLAAVGAVIAAVVSLGAYVFSNPVDMNNWRQRVSHKYYVEINEPEPGSAQPLTMDIRGTAKLPEEWSLVVFTQTPDEMRYYVSSGGAVVVAEDGQWEVLGVPIGSQDPNERLADANAGDYKVVAVLVDEIGQEQLLPALTQPDPEGASWLPALPHNTAKDMVRVRLDPDPEPPE